MNFTRGLAADAPNVEAGIAPSRLCNNDLAPLPLARLVGLYHYAWFIGFAVSFVLYLGLRKAFPRA